MTDLKRNVPELRFPEFEGEWEEKPLNEKVEFYSGLTYSPDDITDEKGTFVVRSSNIKNNRLIDADNVYVNLKKLTIEKVKDGDIIVVVRNGSRKLIGKHALVSSTLNNTVIGAFMTGIRTDNSLFINALLDTETFKRNIHMNLGATINQITVGMFKKMKFYIPIDSEQQKIGGFFSKLDRQIELEEQKLALLEEQKKGYMQKIFSQELRFKDDNRNDYPEWEERKLEDIANYRRGSFPQPYGNKEWYDEENGEPFVQVYDVDSNMKLNRQTKQKISQIAKPKSVKGIKGNIVITLQGSIGRVAVLQYDAYIDRTLLLINSYKKPVNTDYIKYVLYLLFLREKERAPGGTIKTITKNVLSNFKIKLPVLEEQQKIGNFFNKLDQQIELQGQKVESLKQRKKGLLQKMFV
ncbi:restriction endonuclease subunit S [Staphylococcus pseudintermedius]|nr:restriction endonuclease subunit S [Staphylococcus pseudintermedius]QWQ55177.1 restriction endonuclease subunit S [Staphylococcus pseudintermedius]